MANKHLQELPASIAKSKLPGSNGQTCIDWAAFTGAEFVDQIDSGL